MATYYVLSRNNTGMFWRERNGSKLKNEYGLDLFIEKRNISKFSNLPKWSWIITEARSGMNIAEASQRKLAIENLTDVVNYHGIDTVKKKEDEAIDMYGANPLYTDKPKLPVIPLEKEEKK